MAYQAYYYASDPDKVNAVFGSKNKDFLETIKENKCYQAHDRQISVFRHLMIDIVMHYEGPDKPGKKRFGLFPIKPVDGLGLSPRYAETYGFAVEALCDYYGDELECPEEIFNYGRHWDAADKYITDWGGKVFLNKTTAPSTLFDLPKIKKFPVINYYNLEELKELNELLEKNLNQLNSDDKSVQLLFAFHKHIKHCLQKTVPMVSFLY